MAASRPRPTRAARRRSPWSCRRRGPTRRVDDDQAGLAEEVLQVVPLHGRVEAPTKTRVRWKSPPPASLGQSRAGPARRTCSRASGSPAAAAAPLPSRRRRGRAAGSPRRAGSAQGARASRGAAPRGGAAPAPRTAYKAASIARRIDCSDSALDCTASVRKPCARRCTALLALSTRSSPECKAQKRLAYQHTSKQVHF